MNRAHKPSRGALRTAWGRGWRWVGALMLTLFAWTAVPQVVMADPGRAIGWEIESATERVGVGRVVLNFDPSLRAEAFDLIKEMPGWWSEIEEALIGDLDDELTVHFVTHAGRIADATGMPRWAKGVANPPRGEIIISLHAPDGARSDYVTTLRHEMVHVALYRAAGDRHLPRWFQEGVAQSLTEEVDFGRAEALAAAVFGAGVPELAKIDASFHAEQREAGVAYAAARDFVTFLRYFDGEGDMFKRVLSELRNGHGFEASFLRAFDLTLDQLEAQWRSGLIGRFIWYPLLASGTLPFMLFVPVGVAAWVRKRKAYKRGLARLEAEEAAEHLARAEAMRRAGLTRNLWH